MMSFLYNIFIFLYHLLIAIVAPVNKKAKLFREGRKNLFYILREHINPGARYIWFHCASLGEFEQGRPVMEEILQKSPHFKLVLTFFSPSGYEVRKNYAMADLVFYLPSDTPRNASLLIKVLHPEMVFFVKYEFWYNIITCLKRRGIPVFLVSGTFRKSQVFFSKMPWGRWFRKLLKAFTRIFVQDEESAALLNGIGITNYTVSGDTRFDRVAAIAKSSQPHPIVDKFTDGKPVLIAGSTWRPDEELIVPFINSQEGWKFIIAPHVITPGNINSLARMLKKAPVLLSKAGEQEIRDHDVLIIDSVGLLSSLYRYGTVAYIGGGFGVGIHNILEAAVFGLPVFFGPNYRKFREARQLKERGAAFPVSSAETFRKQLFRLVDHPELFRRASDIASEYVKNNQGATRTILDTVFS